MNPLPTFSQILEVKRLLNIDFYDVSDVARLTGVPLRDVFRIAKSMLHAISFDDDGVVRNGQHRLVGVAKS